MIKLMGRLLKRRKKNGQIIVQNIVREDSVKIIEVIKEAKKFLGFSLEKKVI